MVDPISASTMAAISIGSSIAGGGVGAFGALMGGSAESSMYQYRAGMALMNKRIDQQNAQYARDAGDINAMEKGLGVGQNIAQTKVMQAASGNDVNTGTAALVRGSQHTAGKYDQDVIRFDAAKTAYGYDTKAAADEAEANLDFASADNAKTAGQFKAISSILGAASSVATKWQQGSQEGIFGGSQTNDQGDPWAGMREVS